jgi:hypothetical protein
MISFGRAITLAGVATCLIVALSWTAPAYAEVKTLRGGGKIVTVLSETKMLPGDDAKHEVIMARRIDVQKDELVGDAQVSVVNVSDVIAGTGTNRGYRTVTTTGGDKAFVSYEGTVNTVMKAGGPPDVTFLGTWRFLGGTGKFSGLTGNGTYRGQLLAAGIAYDYEGQYEIKK